MTSYLACVPQIGPISFFQTRRWQSNPSTTTNSSSPRLRCRCCCCPGKEHSPSVPSDLLSHPFSHQISVEVFAFRLFRLMLMRARSDDNTIKDSRPTGRHTSPVKRRLAFMLRAECLRIILGSRHAASQGESPQTIHLSVDASLSSCCPRRRRACPASGPEAVFTLGLEAPHTYTYEEATQHSFGLLEGRSDARGRRRVVRPARRRRRRRRRSTQSAGTNDFSSPATTMNNGGVSLSCIHILRLLNNQSKEHRVRCDGFIGRYALHRRRRVESSSDTVVAPLYLVMSARCFSWTPRGY
jgi:hypothetical protein